MPADAAFPSTTFKLAGWLRMRAAMSVDVFYRRPRYAIHAAIFHGPATGLSILLTIGADILRRPVWQIICPHIGAKAAFPSCTKFVQQPRANLLLHSRAVNGFCDTLATTAGRRH